MGQVLKPTVLIVEDEALIRMLAADGFEEAGFEVIEAEHAAEALAIQAGDRAIQFLFTDVNMPGELNGMDLVERVRALEPTIHIFIASALPLARSIDHIGAMFFPKPYRIGTICSAALALYSP